MAVVCVSVYKLLIFILFIISFIGGEEKVTYVHTERPRTPYFNPKYFTYFNMTAHRHGRNNKIYYVYLFLETRVVFANNVSVDFYFYEWLTNKYHRSFVEMHFKLCDLIHKDKFFGIAMKQGKLDRPCPYPPDQYHLYNMTVLPDAIPLAFPFKKGRIEANVTNVQKEFLAHCYIDFEIRQVKVRNRIKNSKL